MVSAVLIWSEEGRLQWKEVSADQAAVIGRDPASSNITLKDRTVSRSHAMVRGDAGTFVIEHIGESNPTKLNNRMVEAGRPSSLSDRDKIEVGAVTLDFHHLAGATRTTVVLNCNHCSRENPLNRKDCWYCGENLVNAPTTIPQRQEVVCRIAAPGGRCYDLYTPGEFMAVSATGDCNVIEAGDLPEDIIASIQLKEGAAILTPTSPESPIILNGNSPTDEQALKTGDVCRAGTEDLMVIVH